jgi:hypothetical protein
MQRRLSAFAIVCAIAFPSVGTAQDVSPSRPVEAESYHVPMFQNELVTVLRVQIAGGRSTGYHVHSRDQFGVVVAPFPAKAYAQILGQAPRAPRQAPVGEVTYSSFFNAPVTHRIVNPDTIPLDRYDILLNSRTPAGFTPAARDVPGYTQLFDNDRVRAWRLVLGPDQTAPSITQAAPGVRVVVRGGEIEEIRPGKRDRDFLLRATELYWQDPGATRAVHNIGTTTIELVEFEIK